MNETLKSVVRVLEEGSPELKVAAVQILGELQPSEPAVVQTLAALLERGEGFLAPFLIDALARIGSEAAVRVLLEHLTDGGAMAERVRQVLGKAGTQATRAIAEHFDKAAPDLQLQFLEVLGQNLQKESLAVMQRTLLGRDRALAERAAQVLLGRAAGMTPAQRKQLIDSLQQIFAREASLDPERVATTLHLLAKLAPERSKALLLRHVGPKHQAPVRRAALLSLVGVELTSSQLEAILDCLFAEEIQIVHAAMDVLREHVEFTAAGRNRLKKMLQSEREDLRLFALRALRNVPTAEVGQLCLPFLLNGNPDARQAATESLGRNAAALETLFKAFLAEKAPDRARALAQPLAQLRAHFKPAQVRGLVERATKLVTDEDPLGDVTLALAIGVDPERSVAALVDRAVRLRRSRKPGDALSILMRLAQSPNLSAEGRYQLALCRLLTDPERLRGNGEGGDATMGHFAGLVRDGFPLLERLRKEAQIGPDLLLRLGRHFAGGVGIERRFGAECLRFVAEKHARAKVGEEARQTLRVSGF